MSPEQSKFVDKNKYWQKYGGREKADETLNETVMKRILFVEPDAGLIWNDIEC